MALKEGVALREVVTVLTRLADVDQLVCPGQAHEYHQPRGVGMGPLAVVDHCRHHSPLPVVGWAS